MYLISYKDHWIVILTSIIIKERIISYIPKNSFIVRTKNPDKLEELEFVIEVNPYSPSVKVEDRLKAVKVKKKGYESASEEKRGFEYWIYSVITWL